LYNSIQVYVTAGAAGVLRVVYAPIRTAIEKRYLARRTITQGFHQDLVDYYMCMADPENDTSFGADHAAAMNALPAHVLEANGPTGLEQLFLSPGFLRAKITADGCGSLVRDLRMLPSAEFPLVGQVLKVINNNFSLLNDEPVTLPFHMMTKLAVLKDSDAAVKRFYDECHRQCVEYYPTSSLGVNPILALDEPATAGDAIEVGAEDNEGVQPPPSLGELHS
jgi:hypothetical protein